MLTRLRISRSPRRVCARASSRSHELSVVLLGINNSVKKRLDLAAKALAKLLNSRFFGTAIITHTRTGGGGGAVEREGEGRSE
jgi:hypothetical protein